MGKIVTLEKLLSAASRRTPSGWAGAMRETGRNSFRTQGLPTRRAEAWKYSDLARSLESTPPPPGAPKLPPDIPGANTVAFRQGVLDSPASCFPVEGFTLLNDALADEASPYANLIGAINPQSRHPVVCLNTALMEDGFILHVPKGVQLDVPLHAVFDWGADPAASPEGRHIRLLVILEEGARASLIESHVGDPGFASVVTEIRIAPSARLDHVRLEQLGPAGRLSAAALAEVASFGRYQGFYLSEGAHFARHEALISLNGAGAEAEIDGVCLAAGQRHCDNTTVIAHDAFETRSKQSFRNVLGGKAHGVYQGCVKVSRKAQKTDARQMSRSLLLSRKARISTKPELEIYADDVKCAHGATAGELDTQAMFFLRARGIPEAEARAMLIEAFLGDGIDTIADETLRGVATAIVDDWLRINARGVVDAD